MPPTALFLFAAPVKPGDTEVADLVGTREAGKLVKVVGADEPVDGQAAPVHGAVDVAVGRGIKETTGPWLCVRVSKTTCGTVRVVLITLVTMDVPPVWGTVIVAMTSTVVRGTPGLLTVCVTVTVLIPVMMAGLLGI